MKSVSHNPWFKPIMASSMVIPVSKDTLFMRGFSNRHTVDDIRDFFSRDGNHTPSVEFFKPCDDKNQLFVALRFETKDKAKEVISRYNGSDILGDHVTITWFKDLRRARGRFRMDGGNRYRPQVRGDYWDRDPYYYGGGGRQWRGRSPPGRSSRRYERSSSRSASRSRSRSASRSRSRSHDKVAIHRSRSSDSHDDNKNTRSRVKRDSERQRSSARDNSSEHENGVRALRHQRSKSPLDDHEKKAARKRKRSRKAAAAAASSSEEEGEEGGKTAAPERHRRRRSSGDDASSGSSPQPGKTTKPLRSAVSTVDVGGGREKGYDPAYEATDYSPGDKPAVAAASRPRKDRYNADYRAYQEGFERGAAAAAAAAAGKTTKVQHRSSSDHKRLVSMQSQDEDIADNPESPPPLADETADYSYHADERNNRTDEDLNGSEEGRRVSKPPACEQRNDARLRKPLYMSEEEREVEEEVEEEEEEEEEGELTEERHRRNVSLVDYEVKEVRRVSSGVEAAVGGAKRRADEARPMKAVKPDVPTEPASRSSSRLSAAPDVGRDKPAESTSVQHKVVNGVFSKELQKGALVLPHDKMIAVREKKDEIEKAYRQDCETFAVVVKMLISKDDQLEEKLQKSLRENLKDIGQRCIHELREFIEQVKADDDPLLS